MAAETATGKTVYIGTRLGDYSIETGREHFVLSGVA
jgi:hypothetical protein